MPYKLLRKLRAQTFIHFGIEKMILSPVSSYTDPKVYVLVHESVDLFMEKLPLYQY